jgi:hypothetical protein
VKTDAVCASPSIVRPKPQYADECIPDEEFDECSVDTDSDKSIPLDPPILGRQSSTESTVLAYDRAVVRMKFESYPEFLFPGTTLLLRDGSALAVGHVTAVMEEREIPAFEHDVMARSTFSGSHITSTYPLLGINERTQRNSSPFNSRSAPASLTVPFSSS